MGQDLVRFSVAMPEDLLVRFDALVAKRGLAKNRSEVVRDLVRDALIEEDCALPGEEVMGTLTIVFNHHTGDVRDKLDAIQHEFFEQIVTCLHVHLDAHTCMEVVILRGESAVVQSISNIILGTKGVIHGHLTMTTTGVAPYEKRADASNAAWEHAYEHGHGHSHAHDCDHTHDHEACDHE